MNGRIDWDAIDLVVFDVDGTLYDAGRLRQAMLGQLLAAAWRERSARTLRVLRTFREVREALGREENPQFMHLQYGRTAARAGCDADTVRALVHQWMEQRPLAVLRACRQPHVDAVFEALRMVGKQVAVWSDYPARDKLRALDLHADLVACATDPDIARLKPDPRGLRALLERAGVPASRALMVGDRLDRDEQAARRAGAQALILARRTPASVHGFRRYDDAVFAPLLEAAPALVVA